MFYIVSWGRWCHLVVVGTNHPLCSNDLRPLEEFKQYNFVVSIRVRSTIELTITLCVVPFVSFPNGDT